MSFKVTQQFGGGRESLSQQFPTLEAATKHAQAAAEMKLSMKIEAVFRIYNLYDDVVATYDTKKLTPASNENIESNESDSSGGKGQGATFRPTPLPTAPRPPGMPANNWKENPEDDEKDK